MTVESSQFLTTLSDQMADAIDQVAPSIVAVQGGRCHSASGLVWQADLVVTVDQAVRHEDDVTVTLAEGQTVTATLVGRDSSTDLAVFRVANADLPIPSLSEMTLRVGHLVLGAGRSGEGNLSASLGLISRLGGSWRSWQGGQIDQFIRPHFLSHHGAMGTTLLDSQGRVIGLNTTGPRRMMLTIPAATIQRVADQLLQTGRIGRGYLGVRMQTVPISERLVQSLSLTHREGVLLLTVEPDSPADQAGLLMGDILIALEAQPITEVSDVQFMLSSDRIGQTLTAQLVRGGTLIELLVTVGERSAER
jgi:S1-C subfamily serine protease